MQARQLTLALLLTSLFSSSALLAASAPQNERIPVDATRRADDATIYEGDPPQRIDETLAAGDPPQRIDETLAGSDRDEHEDETLGGVDPLENEDLTRSEDETASTDPLDLDPPLRDATRRDEELPDFELAADFGVVEALAGSRAGLMNVHWVGRDRDHSLADFQLVFDATSKKFALKSSAGLVWSSENARMQFELYGKNDATLVAQSASAVVKMEARQHAGVLYLLAEAFACPDNLPCDSMDWNQKEQIQPIDFDARPLQVVNAYAVESLEARSYTGAGGNAIVCYGG